MTSAGYERLFVALGLPEAAVAALAAFRAAAADPAVWRALPDASLHLTLAFLGRRPTSDVEEAGAVLRACAGPAPSLLLGEALRLPPRRPRTLGVSVSEPGGERLAELQARVSADLAARGLYEPETRPFRPHVTVARLRSGARAPRDPPAARPEPVAFAARDLLLMRSQLRAGGAAHEALARVALG